MTTQHCSLILLAFAGLLPAAAHAELKLPAIFSSNLVLQQKQTNPVWGWDTPGTKVTVTFGQQTKSAVADDKGKWTVKLDPVPASAEPAAIKIKGSTEATLSNVLVGEVWVCSGQSNMGFNLSSSLDADLESATANFPNIRLISVPQVGTQVIQDDFVGQWEPCTPQTSKSFSAVGFFYGRILHQMLGVPVGLIDNAWGGSNAIAWVKRDLLEKDPRFQETMKEWREKEATYDFAKVKAAFDAAMAKRKEAAAAARKAGKPAPTFPAARAPRDDMAGQHRPGNLYAGVLHPIIGYGIKGAIWYQGESNSTKPAEYRDLFPYMIQHWRDEWKQGDFPFYWVQLADFKLEVAEPAESQWAELREAQTHTMSVIKNGGQCVITDLGEGNDIHPRNKRDVAERLVRWALTKDYGFKLPYRSPELKSLAIEGNKAVVTIDCFGSALRTIDVKEAKGFAICGEDKKWVWATATLVGRDKVEVSSPKVAKPIAVRYAWADNPVCNVLSNDGLPLTPFRTDGPKK